MKRVFLACCLAVFVAVSSSAQRIYFIYLQTDTGDPFFVRLNDKLYSSTSSGYLILPRLIDSTYELRLGFPGKNLDLDFAIAINKKDHGYLLKNFGEKGWGLFDLQSLSVLMSSTQVKGTASVTNDSGVRVNAFTDMLSRATDDPSLKQNVVFVKAEDKKPEVLQAVQKEEKKAETAETVASETKSGVVSQPTKKPDEKKAGNTEIVTSQAKAEVVSQPTKKPEEEKTETKDTLMSETKAGIVGETTPKPEEKKPEVQGIAEKKGDSVAALPIQKPGSNYKRSQVKRISGVTSVEGFESVFVDEYSSGDRDTIRIIIPGTDRPLVKQETEPDTAKQEAKFLDLQPDTAQDSSQPVHDATKDDTKKRGLFNKLKNEAFGKTGARTKQLDGNKLQSRDKDTVAETSIKKCQAVAVTEDFLKLRRKMAARTNDDGMLEEARKYFKAKCFTTEQIKNLSSMFLSSAGKYNFFEISYDHTSDKENFASLQSELHDDYYVKQFKAILGN